MTHTPLKSWVLEIHLGNHPCKKKFQCEYFILSKNETTVAQKSVNDERPDDFGKNGTPYQLTLQLVFIRFPYQRGLLPPFSSGTYSEEWRNLSHWTLQPFPHGRAAAAPISLLRFWSPLEQTGAARGFPPNHPRSTVCPPSVLTVLLQHPQLGTRIAL